MSDLVTQAWRRWLDVMRAWHRHSVEGIEHLTAPGAKLVVGYHGRGLPLDLGLLADEVRRREGYLPRAILHKGLWSIPGMRPFLGAVGAIPGDGATLRAAVARGETVFVAPGGTYEGLRTFRERYVVDWGHRRGYLRLAWELKLPIVPVATSGVDDRFVGFTHGDALGRKLGLPGSFPFWIALGPMGLYPFTLDFPARFHSVVGAPLTLSPGTPDDRAWLDAEHARVTGEVQRLLDRARRSAG